MILFSLIYLHYFCIKIIFVRLLIQSCCGLYALSLYLLHIIYNASALCHVAVRKNKKHLCREMLKSVINIYIIPLKTRGFLFKTFRVRKYGKNRRFAIFRDKVLIVRWLWRFCAIFVVWQHIFVSLKMQKWLRQAAKVALLGFKTGSVAL